MVQGSCCCFGWPHSFGKLTSEGMEKGDLYLLLMGMNGQWHAAAGVLVDLVVLDFGFDLVDGWESFILLWFWEDFLLLMANKTWPILEILCTLEDDLQGSIRALWLPEFQGGPWASADTGTPIMSLQVHWHRISNHCSLLYSSLPNLALSSGYGVGVCTFFPQLAI